MRSEDAFLFQRSTASNSFSGHGAWHWAKGGLQLFLSFAASRQSDDTDPASESDTSGPKKGVNFESCSTKDDCKDDRFCLRIGGEDLTECNGGEECFCIRENFRCTADTECDEREKCYAFDNADVCVSRDTLKEAYNKDPDVIGTKYNYEECNNSSECSADRVCRVPIILNTEPCDGKDGCYCRTIMRPLCETDANCFQKEKCTPASSLKVSSAIREANVCTSRALPSTTADPTVDSTTGPSDSGGSGLNFDSCETSDDCNGTRICSYLFNENLFLCEDGKGVCLCRPEAPVNCESDEDCDVGEDCFQLDMGSQCISEEAIQDFWGKNSDSKGTRYNYEGCNNSEDCKNERRCGFVTDKEFSFCDGESDCLCHKFGSALECDSDSACFGPEKCVPSTSLPEELKAPTGNTCSAFGNSGPRPSPSSPQSTSRPDIEVPASTVEVSPEESAAEESEPPPCIGIESLRHLSSSELIFPRAIRSVVLCDKKENCATPGHMVRYKGSAMMMKTYCDIVGCMKRRMLVNSPKYKRGLNVPSRCEDMQFTAFAARYETGAEEGVLSIAIRAGL